VAVRFSASGQTYSRSLSAGSLTQFSITGWAKIVTSRNDYTAFWSISSGTRDYLIVGTGSDGLTMVVENENSDINLATATVGTWYYIGVTVNGTSVTAVHKSASAANPTVTTGTLSGAQVNAATLQIGNSPFTDWLNGSVAAVKLWTGAALTADELIAEARSYRPVRTTNLRAWYPLTHPETTDYSGNGQTLTGGTGATVDDGPPIAWGDGLPVIILPATTSEPIPVDTGDAATLAEQATVTSTEPAAKAGQDAATLAEQATVSVSTVDSRTSSDAGTVAESAQVTEIPAPSGTPPSIRGFTTADGGEATITCARPAGVTAGDMLLAIQAADWGTLADMTPPSGGGWAELASFTDDTDVTANVRLWWKVAGASEPSSYTFNQPFGSDGVVILVAIADAGDDPPVVDFITGLYTSPPVIPTPGITPPAAQSLELRIAACWTWEPASFTPPPGYTLVATVQSRNYTAACVAARTLPDASPTPQANFTLPVEELYWRIGLTVGIAPAVTGPPVVPKAGADAAGLGEARAVTAGVARGDAAQVVETATIAVTAGDHAAVVEAATVTTPRQAADAGQLAEQATVTTAHAPQDAGVLAEAGAIAGQVARVDASHAGETTVLTSALAAGDAATLGETPAIATTAGDTGTLTATAEPAAETTSAEVAHLGEQTSISLAAGDTGALAEASTVTAHLGTGDTGTLHTSVTLGKPAADQATLGETAGLAVTLAGGDAATIFGETALVARTEGSTADDTATLGEQAAIASTMAAEQQATLGEQATLSGAASGADHGVVGETAALEEIAGPTTTDTAAVGDQAALAAHLGATDTGTLGQTPAITLATGEQAVLAETAAVDRVEGPTSLDQATLGEQAAVDVELARADQATTWDGAVPTAHLGLVDHITVVEVATLDVPSTPVVAADEGVLVDQVALEPAVVVDDAALAWFLAELAATPVGGDAGALVEQAMVHVPGVVEDITARRGRVRRLWRGRRADRQWAGVTTRTWGRA